jgi:hypothetical protein
MPGIWPESFHDIINFGGRSVHSFLYSPQIFFFFLQQHFNLNELNRILSQPYEKIFLLRNGDWQRFCAGYHEAIIIMSQSITEVGLALYEDSPRANAEFWAKQLMELSKSDRYSFDIKAFIQGLAAISGVLLSLPLISPASRMVSALFGRRLENLYSSTIGERQDKVSPFIRKVRKSIELQANLA